jgi:hypothetical protein
MSGRNEQVLLLVDPGNQPTRHDCIAPLCFSFSIRYPELRW